MKTRIVENEKRVRYARDTAAQQCRSDQSVLHGGAVPKLQPTVYVEAVPELRAERRRGTTKE